MIYLAHNPVENKYYIGKTTDFKRRKKGHKYAAFSVWSSHSSSRFLEAIREYGFRTFKWFVLSDVSEPTEMSLKEKELILAFGANDPTRGYNITPFFKK